MHSVYPFFCFWLDAPPNRKKGRQSKPTAQVYGGNAQGGLQSKKQMLCQRLNGAQGRNRTTDTAIFSHQVFQSRSIGYANSSLENRLIWINEIAQFWKTELPSRMSRRRHRLPPSKR